MAVTADFHVHSDFSGDSSAPMEAMVQAAVSKGLSHVCMTEHYDPDYVYAPGDEGMFELDTDAYRSRLLRLRQEYRNEISVGFGVELGLQPHLAHGLAAYARSYGFDFIIGSSHLCGRKDPYYPPFFEGRSEDEAHREYFASILACVRRLPDFDVYGHLDYVVRYGPGKNDSYAYEKHADILDEILRCLIENEKGIEVNTGGFRAGLGQPNPCADILKRYHALGGEIVTVGSDAHSPADIGSDFGKACDILKACGFRYYCIFRSRMPEYLKL